MRLQTIPALAVLIMVAALTFLVYRIAQGDPDAVLITVGAALSIGATALTAFAVGTQDVKLGFNLKAWSVTALIAALVVNLLFAWLGVNMTAYVTLIAVLLAVHLGVIWKLSSINL